MAKITRTSDTASQGDAYRYTKKVLHELFDGTYINPFILAMELPTDNDAAADAGESSGDDGLPIDIQPPPVPAPAGNAGMSWERHAFNMLRVMFFHDGISDIYFAPGAMRIACDDLGFPDEDADQNKLLRLSSYLQIISMGHRTEYDRHLTNVETGERLTFDRMDAMYGDMLDANFEELKARLAAIEYGDRRYEIIWLRDFGVARSFSKFTRYGDRSITWCHLENEGMFRHYERQGTVRLYLAVLPGFDRMTPDDPEFGESMLGIDIGPGGRLIHVNNRWNHERDSVDLRKGDNKYSPEELSVLLGAPYYELCPPYPESVYVGRYADYHEFMETVCSAIKSSRTVFVDERDGNEYNTLRIGDIEMFCEPLRYGKDPVDLPGRNRAMVDGGFTTSGAGVIYTEETLEKSIPPGWRVPTMEDMDAITGWAAGRLPGPPGTEYARGVNMCSRMLYNSKLHDIVAVDPAEIAMACGISMTMQGRIMCVNLDSYVAWPGMARMRVENTGVSDGVQTPNETTTCPASGWTVTPVQGYTTAPVESRGDRRPDTLWFGQGMQTCTWYQLTVREAHVHAEDVLAEQADAQDLYCMDETGTAPGEFATRYCGYQSAILMKWPYGAGGLSRRTVGCTVYCVRDVA